VDAAKDERRQMTTMWAEAAAYQQFMGRWSRPVAQQFVTWLNVPTGSRWLDVGSGTGELTRAILETADPAAVLGVDLSASFVDFARNQVGDGRARFEVGDAQALPVESAAFDVVVSGLVLNFVPDHDKAVSEMARAARQGGIVAAYLWEYAGGMEFLRRFWTAAAELDPAAAQLAQERIRNSIGTAVGLSDLFARAGLHEVEPTAIEIPTIFRNFDDYWAPFLGGGGPSPTYLAGLTEDSRSTLRERLRLTLPSTADGAIHLIAKAWAVKARR
jgi:ubiquinone/menaquinone biosynthesis C-methylase UbiE